MKASPVLIALLRAVNVGGTGALRMEQLRTIVASLGFGDVRTHLQSGNVVFTARHPADRAETLIETAIEKAVGFRPDVICRTPDELRSMIAANPFPAEAAAKPASLIVTCFKTPLTATAQEAIRAIPIEPEKAVVGSREMYTFFVNGMGTSKLPHAKIARAAAAPGTGRNWTTITKLLEIAETIERGQRQN